MNLEDFDTMPETDELGSFQNPIWADAASDDLMPKIRFTTDQAEAQEAAEADRSNPFDLPDAVFYVEPKENTTGESPETGATRSSFQNDSFEVDVYVFQKETAGETGEYVGPSPDMLNLRIENDVKDLTFAQEQLALAIERGTGVMQAMENVESAQNVLDAHMKLYNEAIAFRPVEVPDPDGETVTAEDITASDDSKTKLGSVSHAQWELEQAYKNDNKIAIENAKRDLAHEKAKEAAEQK